MEGRRSAPERIASGATDRNAQRQPTVWAMSVPYPGPMTPETTQTPVRRATIRGRMRAG